MTGADPQLLGNWLLHGLVQPDSTPEAWTWSRRGLDIQEDVRGFLIACLYGEQAHYRLTRDAKRLVEDEGFDPSTGMVR